MSSFLLRSFPSQLTVALSSGCFCQNPLGSPPQIQSTTNTCLLCLQNICRDNPPQLPAGHSPIISHLDQCSCLFPSLPASAFFLPLYLLVARGGCEPLSQVTSILCSEPLMASTRLRVKAKALTVIPKATHGLSPPNSLCRPHTRPPQGLCTR